MTSEKPKYIIKISKGGKRMLANKQALFDIRMQKRLTQKDLAIASGLSERTINTYESDIDNLRNARYKNVEKVANALGVSVDEIFLSTVSEKPKQPA